MVGMIALLACGLIVVAGVFSLLAVSLGLAWIIGKAVKVMLP